MARSAEHLFGGTEKMLGVLEQVYASAASPDQWTKALDSICELVKADSQVLFARFPESVLFNKSGLSDGAWSAYVDHFAHVNPLLARADAKWGSGVAKFSHGIISDSELETTEIYNDFFRSNGIHHIIGISVSVEDGTPTADFNFHRSKEAGSYSTEEGTLLEVLGPHLQRSLFLGQQLWYSREMASGFGDALASYDHAVFGVTASGRVMFQSATAEAMIRDGQWLRVREGRLAARYADDDLRLQALIQHVAKVGLMDAGESGRAIQVQRENLPPLDLAVWPHEQLDPFGVRRVAVLVAVNDPCRAQPKRSHLMRSLYRLSPMEIRVAELLLAGYDTRELSGRLGIALETARFHVKRVLMKTRTGRQAELVRRLMALPGQPE